MNALLVVLWMIGLAFYVIETTPAAQVSSSVGANAKVGAPSPLTQDPEVLSKNELHPSATLSAHAISADKAPRQTEATGALPPQQNESVNITEPQQQIAKDSENEQGFHPELGEELRVTSQTSIRNGPSSSAELLGTARTGAKLRVRSREAGWVEFIDPSANQSGWISLTDLAPVDRIVEDQSTVRPRPKQPLKVAKLSPKPILKPKQSHPKPKAKPLSPNYAQLPADQEFMPPTRRGLFGLFWKRRFSADAFSSPPSR